MPDITLTIPLNDKDTVGTTFAFVRSGTTGEGGWINKNPIAGLPANCFVHTDLQQDLSSIARARGVVEAHNFAMQRPKPAPPVRVPREKKAKKSRTPSTAGLLGGFNPFAVK